MNETVFKDNGLLKWDDVKEGNVALQQKSINVAINSNISEFLEKSQIFLEKNE